MENKMNRNLKTQLILVVVAVIAVAILAAIWAATVISEFQVSHPGFPFSHVPNPGYIPGDIEIFYIAGAAISAVNITLLAILIVTFVSIYIRTRSVFTIGLLIFAAVLLIRDLTSNPFVVGAFGFRLYGLGPFALLPDLFELVALSILLYLSVKY